jgi:hypothetical protein
VKAADRNFVVVASRLPVDRVEGPDGETSWRPSPGGLVTALEPVMREAGGAWIGWSGDAGLEPGPFEADGLHLVGIGLSKTEVRDYVPPELAVSSWSRRSATARLTRFALPPAAMPNLLSLCSVIGAGGSRMAGWFTGTRCW